MQRSLSAFVGSLPSLIEGLSTSGRSINEGLVSHGMRAFSVKFNATEGELGEILGKHLRPSEKEEEGPKILTTRREALNLYREILRCSVLFVWRDQTGRVWRDVIRESARKEFEMNRHASDPEVVNRMILQARDAVDQTMQKFLEKRQQILDMEQQARQQGWKPPGEKQS